jgi:hypothetical protein
MDCLNLSYEEREVLLDEHPLIQKTYLLITPAIERVYALIRERVWMRRTGTFMFARPRMGKTTCASAVRDSLQAEFPKLFVILFSADKRKQSDSGLIIDILKSDGLTIGSRPSYKDLFNRLLTHIETSVANRKGTQFVLMIDEMQLLSEADLNVLLVLHNRLELKSIKMTTIGFAQTDIQHVRSALHAAQAHNLLARFLSEPIPFDGCTAKEDLKEILYAYDEVKRFPENSDYTYTRFFLPLAYENGFRLRQFSNPIWSALKKSSMPLGDNSIPMEHLFRTVEYLLVAGRQLDMSNYAISRQNILDAIEASNLEEFCGVMSNA